MRAIILLGMLLTAGLMSNALLADEWPQWLGDNRESVWNERGILREFPADGPKVRWKVPVELGYSGPAVASGKVVVTDYVKKEGTITNNPGGADKLQGTERVLCFDEQTGEQLWKHEYDRDYELSYPNGPRATPTINGDQVYVLGAEGDLTCLNLADGKPAWHVNIKERYNTKTPIWGFAAHPLVDDQHVYTLAGGEGSVAIALDKKTGEEVWTALDSPEIGYCPPTMIEHGGAKQLLIWHSQSINSLNPKTGEVYWTVPLEPSFSMSISAPRKVGNLLFASGMGDTSAMLKLDDDKPSAEVLWRGQAKMSVATANSTPFFDGEAIYGFDSGSGALIAVAPEDGTRLWETTDPIGGVRRARHGTGFLVKQDDVFFIFAETGELVIAKLSPEKYEELDRAQILEPTGETGGRPVVWSHPAFAGKAMFARNDKELVCVELGK